MPSLTRYQVFSDAGLDKRIGHRVSFPKMNEDELTITESGLKRLEELPDWNGEFVTDDSEEAQERIALILASHCGYTESDVLRAINEVNEAVTHITMAALFMKGIVKPIFYDDGRDTEWILLEDPE